MRLTEFYLIVQQLTDVHVLFSFFLKLNLLGRNSYITNKILAAQLAPWKVYFFFDV